MPAESAFLELKSTTTKYKKGTLGCLISLKKETGEEKRLVFLHLFLCFQSFLMNCQWKRSLFSRII